MLTPLLVLIPKREIARPNILYISNGTDILRDPENQWTVVHIT
ncbi:9079_t:CDS:2 [Racocetra fulgida]|uniref:9079_t:CDS:1 n=1 Tax=Racocetra fulgida TaxID=60492 RepID=A0A9N8W4X3_9GLOM|nr:9079_t:CDS:2 [Racocetra fulgida]